MPFWTRVNRIWWLVFGLAAPACALVQPTLDQHTKASPLYIAPAFTFSITGNVALSTTTLNAIIRNPNGTTSYDVSVRNPAALDFSKTNQGVQVLNPSALDFSKTNQGAQVLNPTDLNFSKTNQGVSVLNPVVPVAGSLWTDTNMDGIVDSVETGTPFVSGVAKHVLAIGVRPSASSYRVTMTAATITNLTPATLAAASHITIFNDDNAAMFVGGADVASSGDHLGVTIPAGGSYTLDQINGGFTIFGINTGAGSAEILRW